MTTVPLEPHFRTAEFRSLVNRGVADHLHRAEQALRLAEEIGEHAWRLNQDGYGHVFRVLQVALADELTLSLTKLFEPVNPPYPTQSLPAVLGYLAQHSEDLPLLDRSSIQAALVEFGVPEMELVGLSDGELTKRFSQRNGDRTPDFSAFKFRRDKQVAHSEAIAPADQISPRWAEARELLAFGQRFAGIIGRGYMGFHFEASDGTYMYSSSAKEAAVDLHRLFESCDLLDTTKDQRVHHTYRGLHVEAGQEEGVWVARVVDGEELLTGVSASLEEALSEVENAIEAHLGPEGRPEEPGGWDVHMGR